MRVKHTAVAIAAAALLAVFAAACGGGEEGGGSGTETVSMGTVRGSSADAAVFIGIEKGYFEQQGIKIKLEQFNTGAQFVAPLGSGELDAASGGISAGLFNAVANDVGIKMVAGKSEVGSPSYSSLLVRKELVDSGRYKGFEDLKGMKVAIPSLGVPPHYELALFLRKAGLDIKDVRLEQIGFADMVPALKNGSVDAAIAIEPSATLAVQSDAAKRVAGSDEVFPGEQTAVIMFNERFVGERSETAQKVMNGYLKAVRFYTSALDGSRLTGPRGKEVAQILTRYTTVKDPSVYMDIPLHVIHPNAPVHVDKVQRDVDFWREQGLIKTDVDVSDAVDSSFVDKTVKELGPPEEPQK
jgi:NitT/TauT family transport system substrate-binding protein